MTAHLIGTMFFLLSSSSIVSVFINFGLLIFMSCDIIIREYGIIKKEYLQVLKGVKFMKKLFFPEKLWGGGACYAGRNIVAELGTKFNSRLLTALLGKSSTRSIAFTLAEVLITLGIIGVVAAMTLPSVINNYKRTEAETALKRAYSLMSQALRAAVAEHGDINDWPEWDDATLIFEKYLTPELKVGKSYGSNDDITKIMCYEGKNKNFFVNGDKNYQYGWLDQAHTYIKTPFIAKKTASIKLVDGTCIGLNPSGSYGKQLYIDINGNDKGPNIAGKDLFFFIIVNNELLPYGYDWPQEDLVNPSVQNSCVINGVLSGLVCAARIMRDGWQIKYY